MGQFMKANTIIMFSAELTIHTEHLKAFGKGVVNKPAIESDTLTMSDADAMLPTTPVYVIDG